MANASDNAGSRNSGLNYGKGLICIVILQHLSFSIISAAHPHGAFYT